MIENAWSYQRRRLWSNRTINEKKLIVACGILSIFVIIFVVCTFVLKGRMGPEVHIVYVKDSVHLKPSEATGPQLRYLESICNSEICRKTAFQMTMNMKKDVEPCDDFYRFSCGGFAEIRADNWDIDRLPDETIHAQILDMLKNADLEEQTSLATWSAINLFRKCTHQDLLFSGNILDLDDDDDEYDNKVYKLIAEILGTGWPVDVGHKWNEEDFDWSQSLARAIKMDINFIMNVKIILDTEDPSLPAVRLEPKVPRIYRNVSKIICTILPYCTLKDRQRQDIKSLSLYLDSIKSDEHLGIFSRKHRITDFRNKSKKESNDLSLRKYNLAYFRRNIPEVNWKAFFSTLLEQEISDDFWVLIDDSEIDKLMSLLIGIEDHKRDFANAVGVFSALKWGDLYSSELREYRSLETICFDFVQSYLDLAVVNMFMNKYLPSDVIHEITEDMVRVKNEFRKLLTQVEWMDEKTKIRALRKMDNMLSSAGLPTWALDRKNVEEYYHVLRTVQKLSFYEAANLAIKNKFTKKISKLKKPFERSNLDVSFAMLSNAYYDEDANSVYISLGYLLFPYYALGRPRAARFGYFSGIVGHEITHGFDSHGKNYDENGQKRNWWGSEANETFYLKAQCLIDQYSGIKDQQTNSFLDGITTLAENIADNAGIRASYQAYKNYPVEREIKLIDLEEFTEDQLFFIASAQQWCNSNDKSRNKDRIQLDVHSLDKYRVLIPLANFEEFSKAFNCEVGTKMNPKKKCRIW